MWTHCLHPESYLLDPIDVISTGRIAYVRMSLPVTETNRMIEAEPERLSIKPLLMVTSRMGLANLLSSL